MKYKAIIFDMDGTIIDTEIIWKKATHTLLTRRGVEVTPELEQELSHRLNGIAIQSSCRIIKEISGSQEPVEQLVAEKSALACELYEQGIDFISGFPEFHKKLKDLSLKTGLATNANDDTLNLTKRLLKLEQFFGTHLYNISCVNNKGKPHPDIYLHTAARLEINPTECIAFEDSAHGIAAAQAAGMFCVGITTSGNPRQTENADLVIDSYDQINLLDLLSRSK